MKMTTKRYYLRFKPSPNVERISKVRLTGWKEAGRRRWEFPGISMPGPLKDYLGLYYKGGWHMRVSDREMVRRITRAARQSSICITPELGVEKVVPMDPSMEEATAVGISKLRIKYRRYSQMEEPAICFPPEPLDFFERVVTPIREWVVFTRHKGEWRAKGFGRLAYLEIPQRLLMFDKVDGGRRILGPCWNNAGGNTPETTNSWTGLVQTTGITHAWQSNLTTLEYCLDVLDTSADPIEGFPRFQGGRVTQMTLMHAYRTAKDCSVALWHLSQQTPKAWEYI